MRTLVALPVYNEEKYVTAVLDEVRRYARDILVIDDGSTDQTPVLLTRQPVEVIRHAQNLGYGRAMIDAFRWAFCYGYDWLITMDCDLQHQPSSLPEFFAAIERDDADVISGSRYLVHGQGNDLPPPERQAINAVMTRQINRRLELNLTDAFCGFKAYRVEAVRPLTLDEPGYAFPLQFWVQAACHGLRISEIPVRRIYHDPNRTFGGQLDDAKHRLAHYRKFLNAQIAKATADPAVCPTLVSTATSRPRRAAQP